jgi:hypothetical protein
MRLSGRRRDARCFRLADALHSSQSKVTTGSSGPESPTTARPLEMDDDDVQESGIVTEDGKETNTTTTSATTAGTTTGTTITAAAAATTTTSDDAPPPQPPRPLTEMQKNEHILKEAFPDIDLGVIKAVLRASGGRIDPAFNALLGMSDPDAVQNEVLPEAAPPQPPRPTDRSHMSQLEADEAFARRLAEQDNVGAYEARTASGDQQPRRQATGLKPNEMYDREHSFFDDDLPVIQDNLRKGFLTTQKQVNTWFTNLKKRIDGDYDSEEDESQPSKHSGYPPRRSGEGGSRRSNDYHRYDADPQVLGDDFAGIRLNPDGTQGRSGNPDLYRPPPSSTSPRPDGRKVAFQEGHQDIDDPYDASPKVPPKDVPAGQPASGGKASKWQPMTAVDPNPIGEHDPFSLGDSEDEKDAKDKRASKEIKSDDSERLKQATADAMADSLMEKPAAETGPAKETKEGDAKKE